MKTIWLKYIGNPDILNENVIYESILWEYVPKKDCFEVENQQENFQEFHYKLCSNNKFMKSNKDGTIMQYLCIDQTYLSKMEINQEKTSIPFSYSLLFSSDRNYIKDVIRLYTNNENEMVLWFEYLKPYCVLQKLHKDFLYLETICEHRRMTVSKYKSRTLMSNDIHRKKTRFNNLVKNQLFAVKTYRIEQNEFKDKLINSLKEEIQKEINLCQILKHPLIPNFVTTYEDIDDNHTKYAHLIFEWIEGPTLLDYIKINKKIGEPKAAMIMKSLFEVLVFMHERRIIHKDIKPSNIILVTKTKQNMPSENIEGDQEDDDIQEIRVIDFNISTFTDEIDITNPEVSGTPGFIAPEILAGKPYDEKVDIFSCGILLYIMLTGTVPYNRAEDKNAIVEQNLKHQLKFSGFEWDMLTDDAKNIVKKLTAFNPDLRYSAQEALKSRWLTKNISEKLKDTNENAASIRSGEMYDFKPKYKSNLDCMSPTYHSSSRLSLRKINRFPSYSKIELRLNSPEKDNGASVHGNLEGFVPFFSSTIYKEEENLSSFNLEDEGCTKINYNHSANSTYVMQIKKKPLQHRLRIRDEKGESFIQKNTKGTKNSGLELIFIEIT